MKQNIYIAALLAGMLALAGCGGGSATEELAPPPSYAETQSTAIGSASTAAAVQAIVDGLDNDRLTAAELAGLQGGADRRKGEISTGAVSTATAAINAAGMIQEVEFQLETARRNPDILESAHSDLEMAAADRKASISSGAVTAALAAISGADSISGVDSELMKATGNPDILQAAKSATGDGSLQKAAADRKASISSGAVNTAKGTINSADSAGDVDSKLSMAKSNPDILESAHGELDDAADARKAMLRGSSQLQELMAAGTALMGTLNTATGAGDAVTQQQIDDAESDLAKLKTEISEATDVDDAGKAPYVVQRDNADGDNGQIAKLKSTLSQVAGLNGAYDTLVSAAKWTADGGFEAGFQPTRSELTAIQNAVVELRRLLDEESGDVEDTGRFWYAQNTISGWADGQDTRLASLETEQDNRDNAAALAMARNLHAALAGTPAATAVTFDGTKVDAGSTELVRTTDSVSTNSGWTGGHFAKDKQEARVYWRTGGEIDGVKFSEEFHADFMTRTQDPGVTSASAASVLNFAFDATTDSSDRIVIDGVTGTSGTYKPKDPVNDRFNLPGSYYGVRGTYQCVGASTCAVTRHADEERKLSAGIWTFTPTSADDTVTNPKNLYAYYGWWLDTGATGDTYAVRTFSGTTGTASASGDARRLNQLTTATTGTATYEGGAAGKYAIYSSVPKAHESGHFTANAKLMADFDVAVKTLKGTIDKFMVDGKEKAGWTITLTAMQANSTPGDPPVAITNDASYNGITVPIAEWKIGDVTGAGTWGNVHFHDVGTDNVPNHVTGEFDATNNRAEITGAFGATKQ